MSSVLFRIAKFLGFLSVFFVLVDTVFLTFGADLSIFGDMVRYGFSFFASLMKEGTWILFSAAWSVIINLKLFALFRKILSF